jgi:WD40 repeat protein
MGTPGRQASRRLAFTVALLAVLPGASLSDRLVRVPGDPVWVRHSEGSVGGGEASLVVGPLGQRVYMAGEADYDYSTTTYDALTGARLWGQRWDAPAGGVDTPTAIAVSSDDTKVIVTGASSTPDFQTTDFGTVAYDSATGAELWAAQYDGPVHDADTAVAGSFSPDGTRVFVTGTSWGLEPGGEDFLTIAYDAGTGQPIWSARYDGRQRDRDHATALAVSPDGTKLFVTGWGDEREFTASDYITLAYDTSTGQRLWKGVYTPNSGGSDESTAIAVAPDGSTVYVTGESTGLNAGDFLTIAYDPSTGARRWVRRYDGPAKSDDRAVAIALSPDGARVFVTGSSDHFPSFTEYDTVAYRASDGKALWARQYDGGSYDDATALTVSPDGSSVIVTGLSDVDDNGDYFTIAYGAASGDELWTDRYDGLGPSDDAATDIGFSPDGALVFVTGRSQQDLQFTYTTIAYDTG